jgi:oligopeptide/dipeptide ABC transporter ATP-binding protein
MSAEWTLRGEALSKHYPMGGVFGRQLLRAVDSVDLELRRGWTLALVGESGCGKSTVGRLLLGLLRPTAGRALLGGRDLARMPAAEWRGLRRHCQMIFQDPAAALNPRRTVRQALEEPFAIHEPDLAAGPREDRLQALLARVGLGGEHLARFPGDLSGGQRQRLVIARALALEPAFLFADEPVASLDVSVRAQVLNLLVDLQRERNLGYLFVSHDLQVVRHLADEVAIMYLGRIVERAPAGAFFAAPGHPYAQVLLSSLPGAERRILLEGDVPSPLTPPSGCPFHPRCPVYRGLTPAEQGRCRGQRPELEGLGGDPGRVVACHFPIAGGQC